MPTTLIERARFGLGKFAYHSVIQGATRYRKLTPFAVEVEGVSLAGLRGIGGIPYVLLHGFGDSKESMALVAASLPARFSPVLLDLPGHGESGVVPVEGLSVLSLTNLIRKALEKLRLGPVHFLGHSLGAVIGAFVAQERPDLIKSLVLLNPGGPSGLGREIQEGLDRGENLMVPSDTKEFDAFLDFATHQSVPMPRFFKDYIAHRWTRRRDITEQYFHALFVENTDQQVPRVLQTLDCPGMMVLGMRDRIVQVEDRRFFQEFLPDLELVCFPEVGHATHLEAFPHLLVKLHSFLRRHT